MDRAGRVEGPRTHDVRAGDVVDATRVEDAGQSVRQAMTGCGGGELRVKVSTTGAGRTHRNLGSTTGVRITESLHCALRGPSAAGQDAVRRVRGSRAAASRARRRSSRRCQSHEQRTGHEDRRVGAGDDADQQGEARSLGYRELPEQEQRQERQHDRQAGLASARTSAAGWFVGERRAGGDSSGSHALRSNTYDRGRGR